MGPAIGVWPTGRNGRETFAASKQLPTVPRHAHPAPAARILVVVLSIMARLITHQTAQGSGTGSVGGGGGGGGGSDSGRGRPARQRQRGGGLASVLS